MQSETVLLVLKLCGQLSDGLTMCLLFLLSITEVNCFLAESFFTSRKTERMMDFRKDLAHQLIENKYLAQEIRSDHCRSVRIQQGISHGLLSLPPFKFFLNGQMVNSKSHYLQKKCSHCPREVQSYCHCSPGSYLCSHSFSEHIEESNIDS